MPFTNRRRVLVIKTSVTYFQKDIPQLDGALILVNALENLTINLPLMGSNEDGLNLTIKKISGSGQITVVPNVANKMENLEEPDLINIIGGSYEYIWSKMENSWFRKSNFTVGSSAVKYHIHQDGSNTPKIFSPGVLLKGDSLENVSGEALTFTGSSLVADPAAPYGSYINLTDGASIAPTTLRGRHQFAGLLGNCVFITARFPSSLSSFDFAILLRNDGDTPPGFWWGVNQTIAFHWDGFTRTAWTHGGILQNDELVRLCFVQPYVNISHQRYGINTLNVWHNGVLMGSASYASMPGTNFLLHNNVKYIRVISDADIELHEYAYLPYIPAEEMIIAHGQGALIDEADIE